MIKIYNILFCLMLCQSNIFGQQFDDFRDSLIAKGREKEGIKTGEWKYFLANKKLYAKGSYNKNLKDSVWYYYYTNSALKAEGKYKNDLMQGEWNFYYETAQLLARINYTNGDGENLSVAGIPQNGRNGSAIAFYDNGDTSSIVGWKNSKFEGVFKLYYKGNKIKHQSNYNDGIENGLRQEWYENGKIKEKVEFINGFIYKINTYHINGQLNSEALNDINYPKNPGKILYTKRYAEDGSLVEQMEYDYLHLKATEKYWHKGTNQLGMEMYYKLDSKNNALIKDTIFRSWHENGQLFQLKYYKKNILEGEIKEWYKNGTMKSLYTYKDGVMNGPFTEWYENGKKSSEGVWKKGVVTTELKRWDEKGNLRTD